MRDALGQLAGAAKEALLALSVGVGLGVLDELIGDDLVIVFENKLDGPVSDRQAREINRHDANIDFDPRPRTGAWRDVLDAFADLVDDARGLAGGAGKAVIEDFLDFCQRHFAGLLPFTTLRRCAGDPQRIRRRLDAIVTTAARSGRRGGVTAGPAPSAMIAGYGRGERHHG